MNQSVHRSRPARSGSALTPAQTCSSALLPPDRTVPKQFTCRRPQPSGRRGHEVGRWVASTANRRKLERRPGRPRCPGVCSWKGPDAFGNGGLCTSTHSRTLNKPFHSRAFQLPKLCDEDQDSEFLPPRATGRCLENRLWEGREAPGSNQTGWRVVVLKEKLTQVALGLNMSLALAQLWAG